MSKAHTVIELNGKRYDALSGKVLSSTQTSKSHSTVSSGGKHIDGFGSKAPKTRPAHKPAAALKAHHQPERSRTLMRNVVKKPEAGPIKSPVLANDQPAIIHSGEDKARAVRASNTDKNPHVSKFGMDIKVNKKFSPALTVKEPPKHEPAITSANLPSKHGQAHTNPFNNALKNATAHTEPKIKKPALKERAAKKLRISTRVLNIGASSLAVLLLVGFITYQNMPNLSLRVAAARAGVDAHLPGYRPAGFSLRGPVQTNPGQVTLTYHSNSDQRQFSVNQKSSNWNNDSLVNNYVAVNNRPYQTYQDNGRIIYIYDEHNATWVDKNVWYLVEGNSSLNSDQLLRIANSL